MEEEILWDLRNHWEKWIDRALSRSFLFLVAENDIKATISHPGEFVTQESPSFGLGLTPADGFLVEVGNAGSLEPTPFLGDR